MELAQLVPSRGILVSSRGILVPSQHAKDPHPVGGARYGNLIAAIIGAFLALMAPFIGCYVGYGDNISISSGCTDEGVIRLACFEYNSMSVSCMLTTTAGGTAFAAGNFVFYSVYTQSMISFIQEQTSCESTNNYTECVLVTLLALECIGMAMTSLIPMITDVATSLHILGFSVWTGSGALYSVIVAQWMYRKGRLSFRMTIWFIVRLILATLLFPLCAISSMTVQSTGPLFRSTEYALLLFTLTTGVAFLIIQTMA
jgi:hypothetical protein